MRLHGHVERGRRFVGDQELRLVGERHGDHHALALPARKLMREGAEPAHGIADADLLEKRQGARARLFAFDALVQRQDLADLPLDRVQRVERGHGLLEHHGDLVAAHLAKLRLARLEQVAAAEQDFSRRVAGGGIVEKARDRQRRYRFAGTGFADDGERLAPIERKRHMIDGERLVFALPEGDRKIVDAQKLGAHGDCVSNVAKTACEGSITSSSQRSRRRRS